MKFRWFPCRLALTVITPIPLQNVPKAKAAVRIVGEDKTRQWEVTPQAIKDAMTPGARKLAESWDGTTCQLHLLNVLGMAYVGPLLEKATGGAKIPHGRTEHHVQKRLMAADILSRHIDDAPARKVLFALRRRRNIPIDEDQTSLLLKLGWKRLCTHFQKQPSKFEAHDIPSPSAGLYSAAKLFGHTGDISKYHLNESKLLRSWSEANGVVQKRLWKACKSHRFGWNFECAEIMLLNASCILTILHKLRVCTAKPNKLVMTVWRTLSCKYTVAAMASRAVMNRLLVPMFLKSPFPPPPPSLPLPFFILTFMPLISRLPVQATLRSSYVCSGKIVYLLGNSCAM